MLDLGQDVDIDINKLTLKVKRVRQLDFYLKQQNLLKPFLT